MRRRGQFRSEDIRARIVNRYGRVAWRQRALATYERLAVAGLQHAHA
jgi:hypothetical protein